MLGAISCVIRLWKHFEIELDFRPWNFLNFLSTGIKFSLYLTSI